jgi:hypothetical protein
MPSINTNSQILAKISGGDIDLLEEELAKLRKKMQMHKENGARIVKVKGKDSSGEMQTVNVYLFPTKEVEKESSQPKITKKRVMSILDGRIQAYLDVNLDNTQGLLELTQLRLFIRDLFRDEEE